MCAASGPHFAVQCPLNANNVCLCAALPAGSFACSATASSNGKVEVVMHEAAPQATGLLLPTTAAYAALPAAAVAATDISTPKSAVAAATLPTTAFYRSATPLPTAVPPLTPIPQQLTSAALPGVPMPAAPLLPQPFPAANPGFTATANPGFPPLIPGGAVALPAVGAGVGPAPLPAFPGALPGDGVMGRGRSDLPGRGAAWPERCYTVKHKHNSGCRVNNALLLHKETVDRDAPGSRSAM